MYIYKLKIKQIYYWCCHITSSCILNTTKKKVFLRRTFEVGRNMTVAVGGAVIFM